MGKTKTAVIPGRDQEELSGAEKYKLKQQKKAAEEAKEKAQVKGVGLKGGERVKVVGGDMPLATDEEETTTATSRGPRVRGKKHKDAVAKVDKSKLYTPEEAVKLVKDTSYSKFDGTVEMHATVKKDGVSVNVTFPHSAGKEKKVEVADAKTIEKLKKGTVDFDVLLATPDMMPKLVPFAKILGPKGMMPNPKNGTLIKDAKAADKYSSNSVTVKTERKAPLIHCVIGKVSQKEAELLANMQAIIKAVGPRQFVKCYLTSSMGPSVKVQL